MLTSFNALDVAQQKVLLSSKLLTEEQKSQCATMVALSSVNSKYTAEQLTRVAGVSAETLANWGLVDSTDSLTIAQLAELAVSDKQAKNVLDKIIAQNAQAVANGEVTASNIALASSEGGATLATGAFTTAIKANISAMWTWMTTTPLGWLTLLAAGVFATVKAYDALTTSVEEQKEKIEESLSAYEDAKSELSSISTELKNQEQALSDLLAKEKLTYVEKGQLEELQAITNELRIQKDLAEKEEARTEKQLAIDTTELFNKQFGNYEISEQSINEYRSNANATGKNANLTLDENNISAMIAGYKQFNELLDEAYGSGSQDDIDHFKSLTEDLEDSIFATAQELQTQQDNIYAYYESIKDAPYEDLTTEQKEIVDTYNTISNAIALIYQQLDPNTWNSIQVDNIFSTDGIEKTKDELISMAQSGELTPETIKGYANLNNTLGETTLSAQDLCDELYAIADAQGEVQDSTSDDEITVLDISSTVDQLNTQLKPTIDSLAEAYQDIFTEDGFTRENIGLDMFSSIREELDNLQKSLEESGSSAIVDYSAYEKLVSVLNDADSSAQQIKDAFDEVALSVANVSVTGLEDFETLKSSLEQLGYVDADLVAFEALVSNIEALKAAGLDLADTSLIESDFISFVDSLGISAEYATQAVDMLTFAQQLNTQNSLDTSDSVAKLLNLAENAGYTGEIIQWLTQLMKIYNYLEQKTLKDPQTVQDYIAEAEALTQKIKESAGKINVAPNVDKIDWKPAIKSAGKAGKDAGKTFKEQMEDELKKLDSVIDFVGDIIDKQVDSLEKAKDNAISAIEAERDAILENIEAQKEALELEKEAIQDAIDEKEKQIDAIQKAREQRRAEIDLMKEQYNLERLQNQKTRLIYKEGNDGVSGQMVYETDTKGIFDQREKVDEAKENLQILAIEREIDVLQEGIDKIDDSIEQLDKQIENINKTYDKMIEQTENYYSSMIEGLEAYASRWEELKNIEKQAELNVLFKNLGIETTDILNMSEDAFNAFKNQYLSILTQMYNGETDMINAINSVAQGIDMTTLESGLTKTKDNIDKLNNADFTSVKTGLDSVSTGMTSVGNSASTASEGTNAVSDDLQKMNQSTEGLDTKLSGIATALDSIPTREKFDGLAEACNSLGIAIESISKALGVSDGSVSGLVTALQEISTLSLGDGETGIISQFQALKTAVDDVTSAINGGGAMATDGGGLTTGASGGSAKPSGEESGGSGLTGAIQEIGTVTNETLGVGAEEEGAEGEGVIGKFGAFKESVDAVTKAIGTGEESEEELSLISALQLHYEKAEETLPQVKARFEELLESITACVEKLAELAGAMSSLGVGGGGVVIGEAKAKGTDPSKSFSSMVGKAFAKGTGTFRGLPEDTLALRSEYGQPETTIYPDGTVELTNSPTLDMLPKGTQILNEKQTRDVLSNDSGQIIGSVFATGSDEFKPVQRGNRLYDMIERFYGVHGKDKMPTPDIEGLDAIKKNTDAMTNSLTNIENNKITSGLTVGDIHVHCSGITSEQVGKEAGIKAYQEIYRAAFGLSNAARQHNTTVRKYT